MVDYTNPDKPLFTDPIILKRQLVDYYVAVAERMVELDRDHLLALVRYPDGIDADGFFQKNSPNYYPDWLTTISVVHKDGRGVTKYAVCGNTADIIYLAQQSTIEFHAWMSTSKNINAPDRIVFDLDPAGDVGLDQIRHLALVLKEKLETAGLVPFIMTTGSRGYHVVAPVKGVDFETTYKFARNISEEICREHPESATLKFEKKERGNKVFLDVLRNRYAQLSVVPYSIRAKKGAPVAAPIKWGAIENKPVDPQRYTIFNIQEGIKSGDCVWDAFHKSAARVNPR